eukprot:GHRR01013409.1.p1 GENE.GHRR01013409.1~~GHRR01013409.1.p1  ORF type:complete len:1004 (+),score=317.90 GHRR01013409.1:346-3357(+)
MPSAASGVRFAPGPFKYNGRVALALVPALLVTAGLGGRPVMGIFTIGTMLWYIMDTMQYREGAFTVGWGTLLLAQAGVSLNILFTYVNRPIMMSLLLSLMSGALLMLTGMWLTVQFRFIQMQYPAVVLAFERQVLTATLPVAAVMHAIGIAAVTELGDVPYYICAALCLMYHFLARPLESSFHQPKAGRAIGGVTRSAAEAVVQSKVDAFWLALAVAVLPATSYYAIHAAVINHWLHFWSVLVLLSAPVVYLSAVPDGLWWLPMSPRFVKGMSRLLLVLAALGLLAGFEGRVVFYAFMPFIQVPPPWNYITVSGALLGLVLLALAHVTGALGTAMDVAVAGSCLILCVTAGSLAVGVPFHWLPAPMAAAIGLATYYDSGNLRDWGLFVVGAFLSAGWFVHHHFWFLDFKVGFVHLHTVCKLAMAALLPALIVPGLVMNQTGRQLIGVLMLVQAELLCVLEEQMYGAHHHEEPGSGMMYPSYLVIATSAAGIAACQALYHGWSLPRWANWVVSTLYVAKLTMLVLPEAYLVLPAAVLLLTAGAPLYMYTTEQGKLRVRLGAWQGLAHVLATVVAVGLARFAVFDVVQWSALGRPHEGVLLGALLVVTAASLLPLITRCWAHNQTAMRLVVMVGVSGLLLAILQPPLPRMGGAACPQLPFALCPRLWDERHVPLHDADDVAVWGSGLGRREHWPRWLLVAAAGIGLLGLSGAVPGSRAPFARLLVGAAVGWLVGDYLALEVMPGQVILQVLVIATSMLVVAFITLLQNPLLGSPSWLPLLAAAWAGAFVVSLVLQTSLPLPDIQRFRRLYPDSALQVESERREAVQASLLGVFAGHALLLAFSLKLKMSAALHQLGRKQQGAAYSAGDPYARPHKASLPGPPDFFCGVVPGNVLSNLGKAVQLEGAAGLAVRRLSREGLAWVPTAGNIATLLAFGICVYLNMYMTGGAAEALVLLAPLLLMLSPDPLLLRHLGERQRYLPPVMAVSAYLAATAQLQVQGWLRSRR